MRRNTRRNKWPRDKGELYDCDECGWTFLKIELTPQRGGLVCQDCLDEYQPLDHRGDE